MTTYEQLQLLTDIFANTEAVDKIRIELNPVSRTIIVRYEDLDDEWFNEMRDLLAEVDEPRARLDAPCCPGYGVMGRCCLKAVGE